MPDWTLNLKDHQIQPRQSQASTRTAVSAFQGPRESGKMRGAQSPAASSSHSRRSNTVPPRHPAKQSTGGGSDEVLTAKIYDALQRGASGQAEVLFGHLDNELRRQDLVETRKKALLEEAMDVRALPDESDSDDESRWHAKYNRHRRR
eukprot:gnl/MRDRNA2_/MRDRNA2_147841_c0_seq1.p2 gnl/MRDRNA2_/MRDRNA2_147841_c0~~gnl/MRDRNA2_/MRDRNA2_147841_c0_seq1.p2  ORF type:complete len:148 (-),score=28.67 gnl/MRDRNA2_/MRDRNA2_147841_c0_seq1:21-464(-)